MNLAADKSLSHESLERLSVQPPTTGRPVATEQEMDTTEQAMAVTAAAAAGGKKRQLDETAAATVPSLSISTIQSLKLEAIFYAKFENEDGSKTIRAKMLERIKAQDGGYLEVSVKHSGSLVLWSGGERFYSKNSTENVFTHAAEILLRQHFARAYFEGQAVGGGGPAGDLCCFESHYKDCSTYLEDNALTLAFEVVTAFLGDHGARPRRDFMILTAVADRRGAALYDTLALLELAHRFRLPHNDYWLFVREESAERLFQFYDTAREEALSTFAYAKLDASADEHVASIYPHTEFQGEIMEGIVIRYVNGTGDWQEKLHELALHSRQLVECVPVERPDCCRLLASAIAVAPVLSADLRFLYGQSETFEDGLRDFLAQSGRERIVSRLPRSTLDISELMRHLSSAADPETRLILTLMQRLEDMKSRAEYKLFYETSGASSRWLCIIHVKDDATFSKFMRHKDDAEMPLFRGFCIELGTDLGDESCASEFDAAMETMEEPTLPVKQGALMLKMKFIPYMVRTFVCRNGLSRLAKFGLEAFVKHASDMLSTKWCVSTLARNRWMPFFRAWGSYAMQCQSGNPPPEADGLPCLTDSCYLDHFDLFESLYRRGKYTESAKDHGHCDFRGAIFVVSRDSAVAVEAAEYVAHELGGARVLNLTKSTNLDDELYISRNHGCGIVIATGVNHPIKRLKGILAKHSNFIAAIVVTVPNSTVWNNQREEVEIKREQGMENTWKALCFRKIVEINSNVISNDNSNEPHDTFTAAVLDLKGVLLDSEEGETRPGMLVFFPQIPGCGKSTLVSACAAEVKTFLNDNVGNHRNLIIKVGDEASGKGKFWNNVKEERFRDRECILIADKNVPSLTWENVAGICAKTKAVAVPVLPDAASLETTLVNGLRRPDGTTIDDGQHIYPFSLAYIIICMLRVLRRSPHSHAGKLDEGHARACMVVIKFVGLYRGIASGDFLDTMTRKFALAEAMIAECVTVPVLCSRGVSEVPCELQDVLLEALQVQYGYEIAKLDTSKVDSDTLDAVETKLRAALRTHQHLIEKWSEDESDSRRQITEQLISRIHELDGLSSYNAPSCIEEPNESIKIVSIDVPMETVHNLLRKLETEHDDMQVCAKIAHTSSELSSSTLSEDSISTDRSIRGTHVTLAHCRSNSQTQMRAMYEPMRGATIGLTVTHLLWNDQVAAFAVTIVDAVVAVATGEVVVVPPAENAFVHMTLWCAAGVAPHKAGMLRSLVDTGEATCVVLPEPAPRLEGTLSFWVHMSQSSTGSTNDPA